MVEAHDWRYGSRNRTGVNMLTFNLLPRQSTDDAPPEEAATFGRLEVRVGDHCLTEGVAHDANDLLPGPSVSGYHIAEWLMWNSWRLRWEARPDGLRREWTLAHSLSSMGAGYVWPNIEISSDGVRTSISSSPTVDPTAGLYRYVGAPIFEVVAASEVEDAIRSFAKAVLILLDGAGVADTNLHWLWRDVERERSDPEAARLRRLEARLGYDPDEIAAADFRAAVDAVREFGGDSVEELAADAGWQGTTTLPSVKEVTVAAERTGMDLHLQDAVSLHANEDLPARGAVWGDVPAWRVGVAAARSLRRQDAMDGQPICNKRLAELAGAPTAVLDETAARPSSLSFVLAADDHARVALRSKWETGRRFDLARLLGDRLLGHAEPLSPATRAYTYRQKAQRAFAAELLCPYEAVCDFLGNDRSEERCHEAASHFNVSSLAIATLLLNNERSARNWSAVW